jgi:hypothetical protein
MLLLPSSSYYYYYYYYYDYFTTTTNTGTMSTRAFQCVSVMQNESTKFRGVVINLYALQDPALTKSKYQALFKY